MSQATRRPHEGVLQETLHSRFAYQAKIRPQHIALSYEDQSLTYAQLDALATKQAAQLQAQQIQANSLVAIMLPRGIDLIVQLLAVLKIEACYVPIDPNYPIDRVEWIINTCQPSCLISCHDVYDTMWFNKKAPILESKVYLIDAKSLATKSSITSSRNTSLQQQQAPEGLPQVPAYTIFTSGSTGKPKGVMVGHQQVLSLLDAVTPLLGNDHTDVWTLFHSFAFDFSVWEIWGALTTGARLCIVPQATTWSSEAFLSLLHQEQVTIVNQTPSAFYALITADSKNQLQTKPLALRSVIFGGEALNLQKLSAWWQRHTEGKPRLINMYGITETTVHASWLELNPELINCELSPIGNALTGLEIHLLDDQLQPVKQGEVGEMYVNGNQLAFGYLGRPDLTASRFIASPFHHGERLYRSGDLALQKENQLFYCGRADRQLKVRGFRVEPAEIEAVIECHPAIQQCIVLPKPEADQTTTKSLLAFVQCHSEQETQHNEKTNNKPSQFPDNDTLRQYATEKLPAHLMPATFIFVSHFPLTANGKLDHTKLLQQWQAQQNTNQSTNDTHTQRMALLRSKMTLANAKKTNERRLRNDH